MPNIDLSNYKLSDKDDIEKEMHEYLCRKVFLDERKKK